MKSHSPQTPIRATRRPAQRTLAVLLLGSLLWSGCTLLNPSTTAPITPVPSLPTINTSGSGTALATTSAASNPTTPPASPVVEAAKPTATSGSALAPQPVAAVPPFVVYGAGKLADSWEDASYGGAKADYQSADVSRNGQPSVK